MPSLIIARRTIIRAVAGLLIFLAGWGIWEFQPRRQVRNAFDGLIHAVERRDWTKVQSTLSPAYQDQWGQDREQAVADAREVFGQFVVLGVITDPATVAVHKADGTVRCRPKLTGTGTAVAQMLVSHVNALPEGMVFQWRRESWKPWDWKLVSVRHPLAGAAMEALP
jgi:hypothetical protein